MTKIEAIRTERYYLAALCGTYQLSYKKTKALIQFFGNSARAYAANTQELISTGLLSRDKCEKIVHDRRKEFPEEIHSYCHNNHVKLLTTDDEDYPVQLKNIHNPPMVLYLKGQLKSLNKVLGIVGSRKASPYGVNVAETFAKDLALAGLTIVSGGARGIDTAAHKGALKAEGITVAVLGCGIDVVYPHENAHLFKQITYNGAIITEFPPGTEPLAQNFPARNRIISGLAQGVLVVEAAHKSGAMITAEFAMDEGRDVYCIPGSIFSPTSAGSHLLLKQGAKLVDRPEDILEDFHLLLREPPKNKDDMTDLFAELSKDCAEATKKVINNLSFSEAKSLEEIVVATKLPLNIISTVLLNLQVNGYISEKLGKRYIRR